MSLSLAHVTFDCTHAAGLAAFWSKALDRPVDPDASEFFATIGRVGEQPGPAWMFIKVPEAKQVKNRVHVDLAADDWAGEVARVVELGATHVSDHDEYGARWATLTDPEGNEFDIGDATR